LLRIKQPLKLKIHNLKLILKNLYKYIYIHERFDENNYFLLDEGLVQACSSIDNDIHSNYSLLLYEIFHKNRQIYKYLSKTFIIFIEVSCDDALRRLKLRDKKIPITFTKLSDEKIFNILTVQKHNLKHILEFISFNKVFELSNSIINEKVSYDKIITIIENIY
jgi:hypothetical protein